MKSNAPFWPDQLDAAVRGVETQARRLKQRLDLAHTYIITADGLRERAKTLNTKDRNILEIAANDLEDKAAAIYSEAGKPSPAVDHMVVVAAGVFGAYTARLTK